MAGEQSDSDKSTWSLTWKPSKNVMRGTKESSSIKNHRSSRKTSGPFGFSSNTLKPSVISRCSTWRSTVSYGGYDLVGLRVRDIAHGNQVLSRAMVVQSKTQRPVQFELTEPTRTAVLAWIEKARLKNDQFLFPSRVTRSPHVSTRQYARIVRHWTEAAGLDPAAYGTHSSAEPRRH